MRALALVSTAVMCASYAAAYPSTCIDNKGCDYDYFCAAGEVRHCQKCLHCEDYNREGPTLPLSNDCIKTVVDCGACLEGLVVDFRGDVNSPCVSPDEPPAQNSLPVYIWAIIVLAIFGFFIAMIIILIYVLRRKDLFRISIGTWMPPPCPVNGNASAPDEPPPPYNTYTSPATEEEMSLPFIKRSPQSQPESVREAEGTQNAQGYNPPFYVRRPPQSENEEDSNELGSIHDADTTPDEWTPNTSVNDNNGNTVSEATAVVPVSTASEATNLSSLIAAARETELVTPPAKRLRRQDNNNNGNRDTRRSSDSEHNSDGVGPSVLQAQATSLHINILQINNTKL